MNKLDIDYQNLVKDILENGVQKKDRTGTGTISVFGRQIRHKMGEGFPLLTTKKMAWKQIVTELLWFLKGDTNIKYLLENDCHIWDGDAYQSYKLKNNFKINQGVDILSQDEFINRIKTDDNFAKEFGELGSIYGKQWRRWKKVDEVWDEDRKSVV
jgi:thymidylate synthase